MQEPQLNSLYQQLILEHYRQPRNKGEMEGSQVEIHMRNPTCGDEIKLQLRLEDLRTTVEDAVDHAEPMAERKGVELRTRLPDQAVMLPHDPPRMGQVLGNLIGNAIKFTPRDGLIEVTVEATDDGAVLPLYGCRRKPAPFAAIA